jgi:hypothetical protein
MMVDRKHLKIIEPVVPVYHCSFCGLSTREVGFMVTSCSAYMCEKCIRESVKLLDKDEADAKRL